MFKRLITNSNFWVRGSRDIFKKTTSDIPEGPTGPTSNSTFPYRFGGVDKFLSNEASIQVFGKDKSHEYIKLYGALLDSIANKDSAWLKGNVDKKLVDPLLSVSNLKQVNKQSPIELLYFKLGIGLGVNFEGEIKYKKMAQKNKVFMYMPEEPDSSSIMSYMTKGIPVLISYHLAVKTSRKLISEEEGANQGDQFHLLTLQQESLLEFKKMMAFMTSPNVDEKMDNVRKIILGSNEMWRVGNIDDFLPERY